MTKRQLAAALRKKMRGRNPDSITTAWLVDRLLEEVRDALLRGEPVQLMGFGTFQVVPTKGRVARRIDRERRTAEPLLLPPGARVKFSPSEKWAGKVVLADVPATS